jgi:hypothetical protein
LEWLDLEVWNLVSVKIDPELAVGGDLADRFREPPLDLHASDLQKAAHKDDHDEEGDQGAEARASARNFSRWGLVV